MKKHTACLLTLLLVTAAMAAAKPAEGRAVPAISAQRLETLRKEAALDPDKFIDEHEPYEVGAVFGLSHGTRYRIDKEQAKNSSVQITVNLTKQKLLMITPSGKKVLTISSGKKNHLTPGSGSCFAPDFIEKEHYSSLYNNAPMPNSVFFNGDIAIHATENEKMLGKPASHGCIRLSLEDSKIVYQTVLKYGKKETSICVEGKAPVE